MVSCAYPLLDQCKVLQRELLPPQTPIYSTASTVGSCPLTVLTPLQIGDGQCEPKGVKGCITRVPATYPMGEKCKILNVLDH